MMSFTFWFPLTGNVVDSGAVDAALYVGLAFGMVWGVAVWEFTKFLFDGRHARLLRFGFMTLAVIGPTLVQKFLQTE